MNGKSTAAPEPLALGVRVVFLSSCLTRIPNRGPDTISDLFISYARQDDEPFVERLHRDLTMRGIAVWWDRKVMPNRGRTFLQELRDAIEGSERVLAVLGPRALASDYVRAEWEHARLFAKGVVFAVRIGSFEDIPEAYALYHAIDFSRDAEYTARLNSLCDVFATPMAPLGTFRTSVPALPPRFRVRSDLVESLADAVLEDVHRPSVIRSAKQATVVQGMGGIGKSVLAAAFARTVDTRRAFQDGVVWVTIGVEGTSLDAMRAVGRALDDDPDDYRDEPTAMDALPELLEPLVCLIVLDDVWEIRQVTPFVNALGPRSRLLITTRQRGIARSLGVREHRIDVLSEEASLRLLSDWSGEAPDDLPSEAREVARQCGYLPFALSLCGAMASGGTSWSDLQVALEGSRIDFPRHEFPNYEDYPDLIHCIAVSVARLEHEDPTAAVYYGWLAVFPPDERIPEQAVMHVWGEEAGLEDFERRRILNDLDGRSLVRLEGKAPDRRVVVHDVLHDYLRVTCEDLRERHQRTLERYRRKGSGRWETVPDDGYVFGRLAYHLREAGWTEELYGLIDRAWMEARFERSGTHEGFLADIELAIEAAGGETPPRIEEEIRGALASATISTFATSVPPEILSALTLIGRSSWAHGLARLNRDPSERAQGLRAIAESLVRLGPGSAPLQDDLLEEALAAIDKHRFTGAKTETFAWASSVLAERGDEGRARDLAHRALKIARDTDNPADRLWGFAHAVESLRSAGERTAHRAAIRETEDEAGRSRRSGVDLTAEILTELAVSIARSGDHAGALRMARKIDPTERATGLCVLAREFAELGAERSLAVALRRARKAVKRLTGADAAAALAELSHFLSDLGRTEEARESARMALHAGPGLDASPVARALARVGMLEEARAIVEGAGWNRDLVESGVLEGLVDAGEVDLALEVASRPDFRWKATGFGRIAIRLAEDGRTERAAAVVDKGLAESIDLTRADRVHLLCAIMVAMDEEEAAEVRRKAQRAALEAFAQLPLRPDRVRAACALARALHCTGSREEALAMVARGIEEVGADPDYATSLVELATLLLDAGRADVANELIERALELAEARALQPVIGECDWYAYGLSFTLSNIARLLQGTDLEERGRRILTRATELAETVRDAKQIATLDARLALAFATFGESERASELAARPLSMVESWQGFGGLTVLMPLSECLAILGDRDRLRQLLPLARFNDPTFGPDIRSQLSVIIALAKTGDEQAAAEAANRIDGTEEHADALAYIATTIPHGELDRAVNLVRSAARRARLHGRAAVIGVLTVGAGVLARIDRGHTLSRVWRAVDHVDSWWTSDARIDGLGLDRDAHGSGGMAS